MAQLVSLSFIKQQVSNTGRLWKILLPCSPWQHPVSLDNRTRVPSAHWLVLMDVLGFFHVASTSPSVFIFGSSLAFSQFDLLSCFAFSFCYCCCCNEEEEEEGGRGKVGNDDDACDFLTLLSPQLSFKTSGDYLNPSKWSRSIFLSYSLLSSHPIFKIPQ